VTVAASQAVDGSPITAGAAGCSIKCLARTCKERSSDLNPATRQRLRLSGGTELSFITAGDASNPAVLLLHGFPGSARTFRHVVPELSQAAYMIAPDLPGFGEADVLPAASFPAFGHAISELLGRLAIGSRYVYLHDFGAPVGFHIAMQAPEQVLGLIVQNANAHRTGLGPQWAPVMDYWSHPNPENEAAATAHLTFEGTRNGSIGGAPPDVAARIPAESWEEDWRVMNLPGRMDTQRALIALWELRCPVRCHRPISRALAAAFPDGLGTPRSLLRSRRDPVMDACAAEDGSPCSRCRPQTARDALGRGRVAHARLHQAYTGTSP
jgi:pimeloyl-ACP methyl ester carboxylesterase